MVRNLHLLIAALAVAVVTAFGPAAAAAAEGEDSCSAGDVFTGCPGVNGSSDGSGVVVTGTQIGHQPGSGGSGGSRAGTPLTPEQIMDLLNRLCAGDGDCGAARGAALLNPFFPPGTPGAPAAGTGAQTVTAADVARFLPAVGALHAEPNGWAVVGVPANFWVDVTAVTVDGTLLGGPAQVRFTPQLYRWEYGDGAERATVTPGASWAVLHQAELTDTSTSHIYRSRGAREAAVEVVYSAAYRVGNGPWLPVIGAVTASTPPDRMLVVTERTVLTPPA